MGLELLNALVRIRSKLYFSEKCCVNIVVTKRMLELFNAKQMYDSPSKELHSQDKQIRELCRKSKTRVMDGVIFSFIMLHINLCTFTNLVN